MKNGVCGKRYESTENIAPSSILADDGKYRPSEYNNHNALYRFGYKVNAPETGDVKEHIESRENNNVNGAYIVNEPNGASRTVRYIANANGFNAIVHHHFGVKYSEINGASDFTSNGVDQQKSHIDSIEKVLSAQNNKSLSEVQNVTFNRFLADPQNSSKLVKIRQSSPKPITNQSSFRAFNNVEQRFVGVQFQPTNNLNLPTNDDFVRQQQYEVIDPEVDIDIRRSISKPFLNLAKLKQSLKK